MRNFESPIKGKKMKIILLPILLAIWAFQLTFWVCFLPFSLLMMIFGAKVNLAPSLAGLGANAPSNSSNASPLKPETSAEFATRFGKD